jgi:hypothetical protein
VATITPAPAAAPHPAAHESRAREYVADAFAGTPGKMRIFGAIAVAACVIFGGLAFAIGTHLHSELRSARAHAQQLVRIQAIRTNLVRADANATNAFLEFGLESSDVRTGYTDGIASAAATIAQAACAEPGDAQQLETVNQVLTNYTGLIESARANNRQGFPVGAAYLRSASNSIRANALPPLDALDAEQRKGFDNSSDAATTARIELGILLVLALALLIATQVWLSRKTRRTINPPLLVATLLVLLGGVAGIAVFSVSASKVDSAKRGAYADTVALATARSNAFDARSDESLTLIARGSGQQYEADFKQLAADASYALEGRRASDRTIGISADQFTAYVTAHHQLRAKDDGGGYDAAVQSATKGAAKTTFAKFESTSATALADRAKQLSNDLDDASSLLVAVSWLMLLLGLGAALAARRGIAQRLREYR